MEERINLIKEKLTGNLDFDIEYLKSMYEVQNRVLEDVQATIEAIEVVYNELANETEEEQVENTKEDDEEETKAEVKVEVEEDKAEQETQVSAEHAEIDAMINDLIANVNNESVDEALKNIEQIIPKIEALSKSESDDVIYCSFSSDFEKSIFMDIFAEDKTVIETPYANDVIYVLYADLLTQKKRKRAAMEALDRAIYWNFLNREARINKLDLYLSRQEIVKYLDCLAGLQKISYTAETLADCYNRYAYVLNVLKDTKSAYALYKLSYRYFNDENVANVIAEFEKMEPSYKELTDDEINSIARDNEVVIGPNSNIIKAHRNLTTALVNNGAIEEAKLMLQNDYSMTRNIEIAKLYDQLDQMNNSDEENQDTQELEEDHQDKKETKKTSKKSAKKGATRKTTKKASEDK